MFHLQSSSSWTKNKQKQTKKTVSSDIKTVSIFSFFKYFYTLCKVAEHSNQKSANTVQSKVKSELKREKKNI